jgi:simple sugar transport system ATP-binding protein
MMTSATEPFVGNGGVPQEPVLMASGLSKAYGGVVALEDADIHVMAHEIVALVGDNGAGKSTLVGCLTGAIQPDSGRVMTEGKDVVHASPRQIREAGVETVYQGLALPPDLSCAAGMFLGREIKRKGLLGKIGFVDWPAMRREAAAHLAKLGIVVPRIGNPVSSLSGGQRQSVAITRAVMWGSRVLILDEPTAALGVVQTRAVLRTIQASRDTGVGVLLVSHNLADVLAVANRVVVLRLGRVVANLDAQSTNADEIIGFITGTRSA